MPKDNPEAYRQIPQTWQQPYAGGLGSVPGAIAYLLGSVQEAQRNKQTRAQEVLRYLRESEKLSDEQIMKMPGGQQIIERARGIPSPPVQPTAAPAAVPTPTAGIGGILAPPRGPVGPVPAGPRPGQVPRQAPPISVMNLPLEQVLTGEISPALAPFQKFTPTQAVESKELINAAVDVIQSKAAGKGITDRYKILKDSQADAERAARTMFQAPGGLTALTEEFRVPYNRARSIFRDVNYTERMAMFFPGYTDPIIERTRSLIESFKPEIEDLLKAQGRTKADPDWAFVLNMNIGKAILETIAPSPPEE